MTTLELTTKILKLEEGFSDSVYIDTEGYPTVGYGIKLGYKGQLLEEYRDFPQISKELGSQWLYDHLKDMTAKVVVDTDLSYFHNLDKVRQAVVLSMCYQLGISGFKKFRKTNAYLKEQSYDLAAMEMMDSLWAEQVPLRSSRHSRMIKDGELLNYYS